MVAPARKMWLSWLDGSHNSQGMRPQTALMKICSIVMRLNQGRTTS